MLDLHQPAATHADATAEGHRGVWIYWRPGCSFCLRLTLGLTGRRRRARWIDIWSDDAARAYVAGVNGGDEVVPTVVIDGVPHTNPAPSLVRSALA